MSWIYDNSNEEWRYSVQGREILIRVAAEAWSDFLYRYGGSYIRHNGFTIPVPAAKYFISEEEIERNQALIKILEALVGKED